MKITVYADSLMVSTTASIEDLALLKAKRPESLCLYEGEGKEKKMVFRVDVGNESCLQNKVACFTGNTNTEPKEAVLTVSLAGKPEGTDVKEYVAEKFGAAILNLQKVETQFADAIDSIGVEQETLAGLIQIAL